MIAWLIQSQADLIKPPMAWLSAAEQAEYAALRVKKRRQDWLAGRWAAKRLIQATHAGADEVPLHAIELSPARGRAPLAWWPSCAYAWPLSISHCDGHAVAALGNEPRWPVGIDLEWVEARPPGFADDYFTVAEREMLGREAQAEHVTAIWCAKEAALKALGVGLTVDTRTVNVRLDRTNTTWRGWRRLEVDVVGACSPRPPGSVALSQVVGQRNPDGSARAGAAEATVGRSLSRPGVATAVDTGPLRRNIHYHQRDVVLPGWWRRHGPYLLAIVAAASNTPPESWPVQIQPVED